MNMILWIAREQSSELKVLSAAVCRVKFQFL